MSAERLRPLAGVPAGRMVVVFLIATFALTWLMFLPVIVGFVDPESPVGLIVGLQADMNGRRKSWPW